MVTVMDVAWRPSAIDSFDLHYSIIHDDLYTRLPFLLYMFINMQAYQIAEIRHYILHCGNTNVVRYITCFLFEIHLKNDMKTLP